MFEIPESITKGLGFGISSAVITALGLMTGLALGTGSRTTVLEGLVMVAIADSMSDGLGIHISEEAEKKHTEKEIWMATFSTFITKLVFGLTFCIPFLFFSLHTAAYIDVVWGILLLAVFSYMIAKDQDTSVLHVVGEHLFIAFFVLFIGVIVGNVLKHIFG